MKRMPAETKSNFTNIKKVWTAVKALQPMKQMQSSVIIQSWRKITIVKESFTETNNFPEYLYGCFIPVHFMMKCTVIQWQDSGWTPMNFVYAQNYRFWLADNFSF